MGKASKKYEWSGHTQLSGILSRTLLSSNLCPITFDGNGSPNQHIYYFKSQTWNVLSNDVILARLFIGTLKGIAFEWFMKLPEGPIKN